MFVRSLFITILLFWVGSIRAQNPFYINYSLGEGFPSSNVYSVTQDEKGFMWFTTDVGIVKYDSHKFELFNIDNGLSDNEVFQMKKDFKGRFWIITLNGKLAYFYKNKLYTEKNSALLRKLVSISFIVDFYEDKNHDIYLSYKDGGTTLIKSNDEVIQNPIKGISSAGVWKKKNILYIFNGEGITNFKSKIKTKLPKNSPYFKMYHTGYGDFVSINNTLFKVTENNTTKQIAELSESNEIIYLLAENSGKIWVCSRNGLFLFENNSLKKQFFKDDAISTIFKDSENGYWLSTLNRGVLYIPSFDIFSLVDNSKINCIGINNKKEIWYGGDFNDYYIKTDNTTKKHVIFANEEPNRITRIRFFKEHSYVIGKAGAIQIDKNGKSKSNPAYAADIYEDDKYIYFGTSVAIRVKKEVFEDTIHNTSSILKRRTNVICKGKGNDIWLGSNYGLYLYNPKDSITYFGQKNKLLDNSIQDIFYDEVSENLLVASGSKGIIIVKNGAIIHNFTTHSGLNSNSTNKIQKIAPDLFLIGTNNGLNSLQIKGDFIEVKNLNGSIGLKNNKINDINSLDNIVYLATDNGLFYFDNNKIVSKKINLKCLIVNLKNQDKIVTENFIFPYAENNISIQFVGISYINQGELTYYYRLNKDEPWAAWKESQINYQSLSANKYKFEVFCQDQLGNKSNVAELSFEILPPFWQKTWFILLCVILFGFGLYYFILFWLKKQRLRFEKEKKVIQIERDKANLEKQMIELEQKALRLQMNPHFIFNALNTIKGYYSEGDSVNASSYISKFSKLLRMLLENTEQTIPLSKEIEMLELYVHLNKIRYKDKFDYKLVVDENLHADEIAIPTLLLQPMVENAIIHGLSPKDEKGILIVSFIKKENQLECIVEDNGIGRTASKNNSMQNEEHQSKALEITTERLNLFSKDIGKSDIEIIDLHDNDLILGTKVIITIPLISIW